MTDSGEPSWILGIRVVIDRQKGTLEMRQDSFVIHILNTFNMAECKPATTPASMERLTKAMCPQNQEEEEYMLPNV